MPSNINVGQTVKVYVRFVDYDFFEGTDELLDPATVTGALYQWNTTTQVFDSVGTLTPIVQESIGVYYYNWKPTEDGLFRLLFIGTLPGATPSQINNQRDFFIGTAMPAIVLGSTYEAFFLGELSPLYLDPERILAYWPGADLVEVTEIIYRLSSMLDTWFGTPLIYTPLMEEWLIAATLCELTKIHFLDGGMAGLVSADGFTLGDLQVTESTGNPFDLKTGNRGTATTWCELAALLFEEMTYSRTGLKNANRGIAVPNPIPPRALRRFE